jgi:hypothetical protein
VKRQQELSPEDARRAEEPKTETRQFLSQIDADLVRDLKVMTIYWHLTASALVGQTIIQALDQKSRWPSPVRIYGVCSLPTQG